MLVVLAAELPLVGSGWLEWARLHQAALRDDWDPRGTTSHWRRSSRFDRASTNDGMRSTPLLIEAEPVDGRTVHVRFEDGTVADVDLSYLADYGGVFEPLRDPEYFRQLRADGKGTIVWPTDADIAPETLYAHARPQAAATT
jgi:hypothetical protein